MPFRWTEIVERKMVMMMMMIIIIIIIIIIILGQRLRFLSSRHKSFRELTRFIWRT